MCRGGDKFTSGLIDNAGGGALKLGPVMLAEFSAQMINEEPGFYR